MKFEMYASQKLLSNYVEQYLNSVIEIQKRRDRNTNTEIRFIDKKYSSLLDILDAHYMISCGMEWEDAKKKVENDSQLIQILNGYLHEEPYSEEELNHIYCNGDSYFLINPYIEIAIKRLLFSIYNTNKVEEIIEMFEKEKSYFAKDPYAPFINLLNQKFENKDDVIKYLYEKFEWWINSEFNCGGYALEIFDWVLCDDSNYDAMVSKILTNPSVRLLGDSLLQDDEYLVVLDATNYHFIKHKDGKFFEKMRSTCNCRV